MALLYGRTTGFSLIWFDDPEYLLYSPHVRDGLTWAGLRWAFTTTYYANWHPLTWLSYMADVELFGPSAGGHHAVNVLLHGANSVLFFSFLRRTTGAVWRSALAAALFAVHPLRVESVAWVAERKDVLSAFFALLALHAYARYGERPSAGRYAQVGFWFVLGLMAKPMVVTLPCLFLVLDRWPLRRGSPWRRLAWEKVPLLALSGASAAVTVAAQRAMDAVVALENAPLGLRLLNALASYAAYLGQAAVPVGLSPFYPHPQFSAGEPLAAAAAGAVLVTGLAALGWRWRKTRPWLLAGWLWYLGTLVPVLGLLQVGNQARADRYTYWPLAGIFLAVSWAAGELAGVRGRRRLAVGAAAGAGLAALSALTWVQVGRWRSTEVLFRHALAVDEGNWLAHNNLAAELLRQGRDREAAVHVRQTLALNPGLAEAHYNAAILLQSRGAEGEAEIHVRRALALNARHGGSNYLLARILRRRGDEAGAEVHFRAALAAAPEDVDVQFELGSLLARGGRLEEALALLEGAVRSRPEDADVRYNLGLALLQRGEPEAALEHLGRAASLRPRDSGVQNNLGVLLVQLGQVREGADRFREALRLDPENAQAAANLARIPPGLHSVGAPGDGRP